MARRIADALERAKLPYGIGGALALGVWGFPRATNDVDVNVFVTGDLEPVFAALEVAGCQVDRAMAASAATERGEFQAWVGPMRVDVFVPSIPFYESVRTRVRQAPLEGRPAWFLSPEDLSVMKFLFFRTKDLLDVERLVALVGQSFDRVYVERSLTDIVGATDSRLERWRSLLRDVDGAA